MRVLLLVHRFPYPPDKGDKIRAWHVLDALTRDHDVELVTHVDDPADLDHLEAVRTRVSRLHAPFLAPLARRVRAVTRFLAGDALSFAWFEHPAARRAVADALRNRRPDVIVSVSAQPLGYVFGLSEARGIPIVADLVDVDSEKWADYSRSTAWGGAGAIRRRFMDLESRRVRAMERRIAETAARVIVTTHREASLFRTKVASVPVAAIPNGVVIPDVPRSAPAGHVMVFVGTMDYTANEDAACWAAEDILPRVRRAIPDAEFHVVGRHPTVRVRKLAEHPGVVVSGAVPSIEPHLGRASVALLPLRVARGVQNKVLEAMASGVPVVTTTEVGDSLGAVNGRDLVVGDTAAELATAAENLLRNRSEAEALGRRGRAFVSEYFRWDSFDAALLECVKGAV